MTKDPRLSGLPQDPHGGFVLKDRYVIERELGRGGIGVVYLARDRELLSRPVVVKILLDADDRAEWVRRKFRHEIEALARIDHPGVVGVLDAGTMPDGKPFLVMQYVEGVTLRSLLSRGRISLDRAGRICRQIGQALAAAHEKGVYHRDLKPDNVMVQTRGDGEELVKLIDFGIATVKETDRLDARTNATTVAGTVYYMAPEQLMGRPSASSDIYALGIIAYEMITGRLPFLPETPFQLPELQRRGVEAPPSRLRPDLPPEADAAVLRALAYEPEDRFASARELGDALDAALAGTASAAGGTMRQGAASTGRSGPRTRVATDVGPGPFDETRTTADEQATGGRLDAGTVRVSPASPNAGDRTIHVPYRAATTVRGTSPAPPKSRPVLAYVAIALVVLAAFAIGLGVWALNRPVPPPAPEPPGPSTPEPAPAPARALAYSITVQKYREGRPFQEPFELAGEINFEKDYRIRLNFDAPEPGRLYVINEGPAPGDGPGDLVLLYPSTASRGGSPELPAGTRVRIPETSWFAFDAAQGTERVWLVWSSEPVPELDALGPANPAALGAITKPEQLAAVRAFLTRHAADRPEITRDETQRRTVIRDDGPVLVHLLRLEHH